MLMAAMPLFQPIELRVRRRQQLGHASPRNLRMLDSGDFDAVTAQQACSVSRVGAGQMMRDQFPDVARKGTRLLLDIDDPKGSLALRLSTQAIGKPGVDNLQTLQRVALCRVPAVE